MRIHIFETNEEAEAAGFKPQYNIGKSDVAVVLVHEDQIVPFDVKNSIVTWTEVVSVLNEAIQALELASPSLKGKLKESQLTKEEELESGTIKREGIA